MFKKLFGFNKKCKSKSIVDTMGKLSLDDFEKSNDVSKNCENLAKNLLSVAMTDKHHLTDNDIINLYDFYYFCFVFDLYNRYLDDFKTEVSQQDVQYIYEQGFLAIGYTSVY